MAVDEETLGNSPTKIEMDETVPLLSTATSPASTKPGQTQQHRTRTYLVTLSLLVALNLGDVVLGPATARIYESVYCHEWYRNHDPSLIGPGGVEESNCKIPNVQRDVSSLVGFKELFDAMPGLLLAIPFGILADKYGRKWLFVLNLFCMLCRYLWVVTICLLSDSVPLRAIWYGSVFNLFGGGVMVAESLFCVILSDVTPRENLTNLFFYVNAFGHSTRIVGPVICASLMKMSIWAPIWLGVALQAFSVLGSLAMPETLDTAVKDGGDSATSSADHNNETAQNDSSLKNSPDMSIVDEVLTSLSRLVQIFSDWRMLFLAAVYPVRMMSSALTDLLPRYISYRYHWSLANATYLYSLQATGAATCLFALLPVVSDFLGKRFELSAVQKSVVLARVSFGFSALSLLLQGVAPSIPVLICALVIGTLGSGLPAVLRALAGSLIGQKDNGKVFTGLAVAETISQMLAYPAIAGLYNVGIGKGGGAWLGMPFDITGLILICTTMVMCFSRFEGTSR